MPSHHERFWEHDSFAVVGDEKRKNFPILTYRGLKQMGKTVVPVDPSAEDVDGDRTYHDLDHLPCEVEAVVLEVPSEDMRDWVARAADAGIRDVWIHMGRETPEALALAQERGLDVHFGNCAVMYVTPGFSFHSLHKWIVQLAGKY